MTKEELRSKIRGSLYGFAIGDAMGATTEFMSDKDIQKKYGRIAQIVGGGWLNLEPGEVTDDTQMTLCVARAYTKAYKEESPFFRSFLYNCAVEFVAWIASGPKDVGNSCSIAIRSNSKENDPYKWMDNNFLRQLRSGREDLGNGALMRCLFPILCGDIGAALLQAKLTHNNNLNDGCILEYGLILQSILRGEIDLEEVGELAQKQLPSGHISNTLDNAIYWTTTTCTFEDSILGPVNDGGDADTIAAITGGLTGALYGFEAIPATWITQLNPRVRKALDDLTEEALNIIG